LAVRFQTKASTGIDYVFDIEKNNMGLIPGDLKYQTRKHPNG